MPQAVVAWHDNYAKYYFKQRICVGRQDFLNNCFTAHAFLRHQSRKFIDQFVASDENKNRPCLPPKLFAEDLLIEVFTTTKRLVAREFLSKSLVQRMNVCSVPIKVPGLEAGSLADRVKENSMFTERLLPVSISANNITSNTGLIFQLKKVHDGIAQLPEQERKFAHLVADCNIFSRWLKVWPCFKYVRASNLTCDGPP